jgi:hypothetical protein
MAGQTREKYPLSLLRLQISPTTCLLRGFGESQWIVKPLAEKQLCGDSFESEVYFAGLLPANLSTLPAVE